MKIGEKIDCKSFVTSHRPFDDMNGLVNAIRRNMIVWSWGANNWTKMNDYSLRFTVNGHHFKGHIYLVVNGSDLFDIYLTSNRGNIKDILTDIYLEDLIDVIDRRIERIPEYID